MTKIVKPCVAGFVAHDPDGGQARWFPTEAEARAWGTKRSEIERLRAENAALRAALYSIRCEYCSELRATVLRKSRQDGMK